MLVLTNDQKVTRNMASNNAVPHSIPHMGMCPVAWPLSISRVACEHENSLPVPD